ncbi:peptidyl-prolyl cis-trans isomerase CYP40-like [Pyrus ussuriensis x Pyrus communis]|uniref:Peptidyl-prolyl cis-trans isomerase CYP40-like n=1 Tax=Pyrus ussuriensis x Pyrus communis TaxID=2448454 RepID=A0A5N5FFW6_9ROSA|nr:peptidyl-prolyl cis-trans isomerase CYP40-like [Pyrus ussuriensis x Pyrus communis]
MTIGSVLAHSLSVSSRGEHGEFSVQACRLKLGDLEGALLDTDFALRDWKDNVKALFRQCQAQLFNSSASSSYFELHSVFSFEFWMTSYTQEGSINLAVFVRITIKGQFF